jgi:hypothetical protein
MFDIFPIDAASLVLGFLIGLGALGILVLASLNNMLMIQKKKHSKRAFIKESGKQAWEETKKRIKEAEKTRVEKL